MNKNPRNLLLLSIAIPLLLAGCASTTVKSTSVTPLEYASTEVAEENLLDVGVSIFNPNIEELLEEDDALTLPEIRRAEARYIPYLLAETLQRNGSWGAVRVIPNETSVVDVYVSGIIKHSDGELLQLEVTAKDVSGRTWFVRDYEGLTSKYTYNGQARVERDPFQGVYNEIANDLLAYREKLPEAQLGRLRTISELRFAEIFSPEAFSGYLETDKKGNIKILRLPPENDPISVRIEQIRERDYLFIDTLQDYYASFALDMEVSYQEWRKLTYDEVIALREVKREARNQMIAGAALVLAGVVAAGSSDGSARAAGAGGVLGGAYLIKEGLGTRAEAQLHVEALQELGGSLEAEIQPQVIELEDRTVTLTGTVDNQYDQWRGILRDIYTTETGDNGVAN